MMVEVRCDGARQRGSHRGMPCRYLLLKVDPAIVGTMETKCPRCNTVRVWHFSGVLVGAST